MPEWLQWVVGGTASVAAAATIWRKIVVPLAKLSDAAPTLVEIAWQFRPNNGHSLHDRIIRIEATQQEIQRALENLIVIDNVTFTPESDIGGAPV